MSGWLKPAALCLRLLDPASTPFCSCFSDDLSSKVALLRYVLGLEHALKLEKIEMSSSLRVSFDYPFNGNQMWTVWTEGDSGIQGDSAKAGWQCKLVCLHGVKTGRTRGASIHGHDQPVTGVTHPVDVAVINFVKWSSCISKLSPCLTVPLDLLFASRHRGQRFAPWGATHTFKLGLPDSTVSLHWWPRRDPWSPAMIGPLTLAIGCFSHLLAPVPFSLQAKDKCDTPLGSLKAHTCYGGGGGGLWSSCISHNFTISHWSSGLTVCFPTQRAAFWAGGVQPTLWNWDYLLAPSRCSWAISKAHIFSCHRARTCCRYQWDERGDLYSASEYRELCQHSSPVSGLYM